MKGRVNFTDLEKPRSFSAIIDKGGLQAGFNAHHHGFVNIAFGLLFAGNFNIEFAQGTVFYDRDPMFFRMGRVNQHLFTHIGPFDRSAERPMK